MDLEELKALGETAASEKTFSPTGVDKTVISCRHGVKIREESGGYECPCPATHPTTLEARILKQCSSCIVEMEILTRLDRIEKQLHQIVPI